MSRRTRTLAGALTLAALTFSFGETVFASMCTQMSDMTGMGDMADMADMAGPMSESSRSIVDAEQSSGADCLLTAGRDAPDERGEPEVPCPLTPAVGSGCSAVASLPATRIAAVDGTAGTSPGFASPADGTDLLLTHGLFRPPRA